jgi:2-polyprenyl-6-methoxyphenol hydroxylase-like FAD-dependent oxidoreductase
MTPQSGKAPQVLIIGAGPTGLMLAGQLVAQGVRCRIIDKAAARSPHSRALVVQPRTLELLDPMGLTEGLLAAGQPTPEVAVYLNHRRVADLDISGTGITDTAYPFLLFVSQVETERLLERYLTEHGVQVERPLELLSFKSDASKVTAQLQHGDGRSETVQATYLIGCDGAHSVVRKGLGLSFAGEAYAQDFVLADVEIDWPLSHRQLTISLSDDGVFVVFPMKGERAYRIIAARAGSPAADAGDPTLAELQALAAARSPVPLTLSAPRWLARFRLHHRAVDRYRCGRCFVAGDAAHIHSPAGGQGMNTGIQDAANLAWKLALVLRGEAPESLLDSYHEERWPVGQALLRTTDRMFSMGTTRNRLLVGARNLLLPLVSRALQSQLLRQRLFRFIGQLGIAYPTSRIVEERLDGADRRFRQAPGKGERAPAVLHGGEALRTRLRGPRHHLLVFTGRSKGLELEALQQKVQEALGPHKRLCEVVLIWRGDGVGPRGSIYDDRGLLHERYGLDGPGLYLLRPDGYIAFRAPRIDTAALGAYLQRVFAPG